MQAVVTIFKSELKDKEHLVESIMSFVDDIKDLDDVLVYRPPAGKLITFLTFLNKNQINYGTHFNTHEE
jgi:hypothetical protein